MPPLLVTSPCADPNHAEPFPDRSWQDNSHTAAQPLACTTITWGISVAEAYMPIAQHGAEISGCAVVRK